MIGIGDSWRKVKPNRDLGARDGIFVPEAPGALARDPITSDEFQFSGEDDAKAQIRASVRYLLEASAGSDRGDIVREIIAHRERCGARPATRRQ